MNLTETSRKIFNVNPGEGLATILLFSHSLLIGITLTFMETASYTLFLTNFGVKNLPYAYIITALITTCFGYIHTKLQTRVPFSSLLSGTLGVILGTIIVLYITTLLTSSKWLYMALSVSYYALTVLAYLEFWALTGRMFTLRQGKRLYGLIGNGETIGGIIAGFSGSVLIKMNFGTLNLLLISAFGMLCCMIILYYITHKFEDHLSASEEDETEEEERSFPELFKDTYLRLVFMVSAFSVLGYYFLDYIFYEQVELEYPKEDEMAAFVSTFLGYLRILTLLFNSFLSGKLISGYGVKIGTLVFPIALAGLAVVAISGFFFAPDGVFFWLIVGKKVFDEVVRYPVEEPTIRILYQPLRRRLRLRVQTVVETMVEPISNALAGVLIALMTHPFFSFKSIHLIYIMFAILAGWIVASFYLLREYAVVLNKRLKRGEGIDDIAIDGAAVAVLIDRLKSPKAGDVIYSLRILEDIDHEKLETFLLNLAEHPESQVRQHVLRRIGVLGMKNALETVKKRIILEKDLQVLGVALQTLSALSETEAFERVFDYLIHEEEEVRKGAMIALLRYGGIDGVLAAGANLNALLDSDEPQQRKLAAQVLGEVGIAGFARPLLRLLEDKDLEVRRAAIAASGNLKNATLLPLLLKNFSEAAVRKDAISAVVAFGESILPELEKEFDKEDQPPQVSIRLIRAMGRIGGDLAIDTLKKKMDFAEVDIRKHILKALVGCRYREPDKDSVKNKIWQEIEDAVWVLSALIDIGEEKDTRLLSGALEREIQKNIERIFLLMALIYPANDILTAQTTLQSKSPEKRAIAFEVLDARMTADVRDAVFPLLKNEFTHAQCLAALIKFRKGGPTSRHERLKQILGRSQQWISPWTKACSLFTIGKIRTMEFYDTVISSLPDPDPLVRETAVWALGCLNPNDLAERLSPLTKDRSDRVAEYTRFTINSVGFASIPMGRGYLTRSGRYTAELFINILQDERERRARRCRAANILSRFRGTIAKSGLIGALDVQDKIVRTAALDALVKGHFDIEENERDSLLKLLEREVSDARTVLSSIVTLLREKHAERLIQALNQEINSNRKRALSILMLLSDKKDILTTISYWYIHQEEKAVPQDVSDKLRTLLLQISDEKLRKHVFTLFHQFRNADDILEKIGKVKYSTRESIEENLKQIAFGSSVFSLSWSRICALEMIVKLDIPGCVPHIIQKVEDADDIVRATSAWALFKLAPDIYERYAVILKNDSSPLVSKTARQLEAEMEKAVSDPSSLVSDRELAMEN
ncbi:Npt1/Npt2 family nucleotide transporter [Desulfococcaceae bacterium HSG8]|nr:Npt1/Npt2 family nucleotide transporter [Desulfococcaceae bacterium HSG8]